MDEYTDDGYLIEQDGDITLYDGKHWVNPQGDCE